MSFKFMFSSIHNIRCAEKAHLFILYSGGDMMGGLAVCCARVFISRLNYVCL